MTRQTATAPRTTYIGGPWDRRVEILPTVLSVGIARRHGYVSVTAREDPTGLSVWGGPNAEQPETVSFYRKVDAADREAVLRAITETSRAVLDAGAHPATMTTKVRTGSEFSFVLAEGHIPYVQARTAAGTPKEAP